MKLQYGKEDIENIQLKMMKIYINIWITFILIRLNMAMQKAQKNGNIHLLKNL